MPAKTSYSRVRNIFDPSSQSPFRISRSKLELFLNCPRCFYLDRRLGVDRPPSFPFNLNSAVDRLLKSEFDQCRAKAQPQSLMVEYGIDAIPFSHPQIDDWREALHKGIQYAVPGTTFIFTGAIDDVWIQNKTKDLIIVDYKATSKKGDVTIDEEWQRSYKNQMEMYQWLFRMNGFEVSSTGYFVYCNGKSDVGEFNNQLRFETKVIPYEGDTAWVEGKIRETYSTLMSQAIPDAANTCDYCKYIAAVQSTAR